MKILFRADASMKIGSGHIMRCMVLAEELKSQGAECTFICSNGDGNLIDKIRDHGFAVHNIYPQHQKNASVAQGEEDNPIVWEMHPFDEKYDAEQTIFLVAGQIFDWVVVDHYCLGKNWDVIIKSICRKLMVIDDLANRHHDCDLLLDQNYYKNLHKRYQKLVPESCICLLGPDYVLLRQEFIEAKKNLRKRTGEIKRVLVFFGGSDSTNETKKILIALKQINLEKIEVDVVVGGANPHHEIIHAICSDIAGVNYYRNVSNMAALISEADIAIGAGGSSIWERCYLGLPSITSVVALNQKEATEDVASLGAIEYLGAAEVLTHEDYATALLKFLGDYESVKIMSIAGRNLVNRVGTTAVVNTMQKN
jgi:UDP-2,4-diacetamido-2,4,6-trideoxy-beta-L-altropyranose hydrolase